MPFSTLIVIPAKNEAATIQRVIADIRVFFAGAVVVIDDGSTDGTGLLARDAGAVVLSPAFSLGAWGAIQTGLRYALVHGYQKVITMDADGQHAAESIPKLLAALNSCHGDVVIGAFPQRGSLLRRWAWQWFRWLSGVGLEDLTSGLRIYNRRAIRLLASSQATLLEYQDMGVLLLLQKHGLRIFEVGIEMRERQEGHSRIFSSWWAVGKYMLHTGILCIAQSQRIHIRARLRKRF